MPTDSSADAFANLRERLAEARRSTDGGDVDVPALESRVAERPDDVAAVGRLVNIHIGAGRHSEAVELLAATARALTADDQPEAALLLFERAEVLARADQRVVILEGTLPIHLSAKSFVRAFHLAREIIEYRLASGEVARAEAFLRDLPSLGERDAVLRKQLEAIVSSVRQSRDPHGSWLTTGGLPRFPPREDFSDLTVLLVDDDAAQMLVLQRALEPLGCHIARASDGAQALEVIMRSRPSLIVSDLMMPDVDGSQLFERLRNDPSTESIPFVCLSSQNDEKEVVAALVRGIEDYWAKPVRLVEFRVRVHRILRRLRNFPALSGDLAEMSVPDLLQMIESNRRTGSLIIDASGRRATVYFVDGRPIDAVAGKRSGEPAVYTIVAWTKGRFEFSTQISERPQRIFSSVQALLLEAMRRFDEEQLAAEALAPSSALRPILSDESLIESSRGQVGPAEADRLRHLLDGSRTLGSVVEELRGELESIQLLTSLIDFGAVALVGDAASPESVDAREGAE